MQTEVVVLNGLTVTVEFSIAPAEPDVGLMSSYLDEWAIVEIAGRPLRRTEKADWLYKRLTEADKEKIINACFDAYARAN